MSAACHGFVQNAWKKDFCSNCFKSKDEHNEKPSYKNFAASIVNSSSKSSQSILKAAPKKKSKRAVSFSQDVCQVIGFGGDVWSDGEEFEMSEDTEEEDYIPDCEEEKHLKSVTKSNTDFNSVKANLLNGEAKKSYTSLLLGKMQTDSDGKKKTLHVSVTPFGHENGVKSAVAKPNDKKPTSLPILHKSKESKIGTDYKTNITLTSFIKNCEQSVNNSCRKDSESDGMQCEKSLLEEISETLEKNRINSSDSKKNHQMNGKMEEKSLHFQKTGEKIETNDFKKNLLNRNNPIKKDSEKPKINMSKPEFTFCKIDIEPIKSSNQHDHEITNNYSTDVIGKSMASDSSDSFSSRSDSDSDDKQYIEARNNLKNDDCLKIKVFSEGKDSDSDDKTSSDISLDDIRKVDGQSDSLQDTYEDHFQSNTLDNISPGKILDLPVIFSAEASRELAGEPDGRADPEELSEPPALPRSPPPQMDPRPSFLHGMIKDNSLCRPVIPEKPKLPMKPLSVIKHLTKRPQTAAFPQQQVILQLQQTLQTTHPKTNSSESQLSKDEVDATINTKIVADSNNICEENESKLSLEKHDSNSSLNLTPNKRKAPKPPPTTIDESSGNLYQRNPSANLKSDSPVVREKEKRERASSCSPKFRQNVNSNPDGDNVQMVEKVPEPAPRRSLSLSHDNLVGVDDKKKGKLKFSLRRLLRLGSSKDLDKKDLNMVIDVPNTPKREEMSELTPKPKPRLVIIHPIDVNVSGVEVVKTNLEIISNGKQIIHDNLSISDGSTYSYSSVGDADDIGYKECQNKPPPPPRKTADDGVNPIDGCPTKPARPPPPKSALLLRQQKQPIWTSPPTRPSDNVYANLGEVRSAIAPRKPERTASMREREAQLELPKRRMPSSECKEKGAESDSIKIEILNQPNEQGNHNYDDVYGSDKYETPANENLSKHNRNSSDSDYEFVSNCSSAPQTNGDARKLYPMSNLCERSANKTIIPPSYRKSDCNIEKAGDFAKMANNFVRSSSLPYCGSETESEIYSPYSFYSCNEVGNEDGNGEFNNNVSTNKLRVRKGRSVVHKNLEDNYGAVVIANHEALAQVLDQVQQSAVMQPSLRVLKTCTNLRWSDFTVTSTNAKGHGSLKVGKRIFHSAVWNSSLANGAVNVTLMLNKEQMASQIVSQHTVQPQSLCLNAVTEFCDLVPLQQFGEESNQLVQATIVVLAQSQMDTIETFGEYLQSKPQMSPTNTLIKRSNAEKESPFMNESQHEATFMMLQIINGLKCLQARGVEEVSPSLSSFVICRDMQLLMKSSQNLSCSTTEINVDDGPPSIQMPKANSYGRLCVLQGLSEENTSSKEEKICSLCECAIKAVNLLLPNDKLTPLIQDLLSKEKAISLSQVKSILEFTLWGPWDVVLGLPIKERELSLQRWLDLERATVLHGLVRTRVQLNVFEQSHLLFLVRSTSKIMCDASVLLENSKIY